MSGLPMRFSDWIRAFPECSHGVSKVVVTLEDGRRVYDVFVAGGTTIVKVGTSRVVPFNPDRIVRVESQR